MRDLRSVGFTISTQGNPGIPIKGGDVKLLRSGEAQGRLQIQQLGLTLETDFVLLGDTLYYKGLTGSGYQKAPKSRILALYDTSAVLDPNRGLPKLLEAGRSPQPEAREKVGGKDAYKVRVTLPKDAVAGLIPGVAQDLTGHVWIGVSDHRLLRVRGALPSSGGDGEGTVEINFTEFNTAYKFTAPA
jgi:lipoprotein LprG